MSLKQWENVEKTVIQFQKKMKMMPAIVKFIEADLDKNMMLEPKTGEMKNIKEVPDSTLRRYVKLLDNYDAFAPDVIVQAVVISKKIEVEQEQSRRDALLQ